MSDQADSPGFEQAPQADQGGSAPDPIMSRLDELASSIQGLRPPEPEPEPEYGDYAFDDSEFAPDPAWDMDEQPQFAQPDQYQPDPQAEQDAWAQINQTIQQQVQQGVQAAVTPFMVQQKAAALEAKYPDLKDPAVAARVVQQSERFAHMIAQSSNLSPDQASALARNPELIERLYLAERAQRTAGQETPANGGPGAHLEGSGAQVAPPETDFFDGLLSAGNGGQEPNRFGWK